jgi:hypothetical protein
LEVSIEEQIARTSKLFPKTGNPQEPHTAEIELTKVDSQQ